MPQGFLNSTPNRQTTVISLSAQARKLRSKMQSACPHSVQIGRAQGEPSRKNWKGRVCWDFKTVTLKAKCTISLPAAVSLLVG